MAAATAVTSSASSQLFQSRDDFYNDYSVDNSGCGAKANREEIQAAIAKAVELRALHAALMQGSNPATFRFLSPSLASASQFSAQDYPIFTPSYEEEPLPGYQQISKKSQTLSENWDDYGVGRENGGYGTNLADFKDNSSSRSGFALNLTNVDPHICPADNNDHKSVSGSSANHVTVLQSSPGNEYFKSARGQNFGDFHSVSSCNRCKPAVITKESETVGKHDKNSNTIVQIPDPQASVQSQSRNRGVISRLFPRSKKKNRNENSPNRTESEDVSQIFKDLGIISIETLKKELIAANQARDSALVEVAEMKSSFEELKQKMEYLETYCEELKRALRQATMVKNVQAAEKLGKFRKGGKLNNGSGENSMPVSEEVMVEGFLQVVSEARLAVKQFCKILIGQIEETDTTLMKNLNLLIQPHKFSVNSKYSKAVLYHLEAIINQSLFQNFENCAFQKNGSPKDLDPRLDRQAQFSAFMALRNLSWNEIRLKCTKHYSDELSKFCDEKMSSIIAELNWTRPWHEQLLQAFFVAAKCIWLIHLLAFSFDRPLKILRVEENRSFDSQYMEDVFAEKQKSNGPARVKIMVMPGFYVHERVLRCKVTCRVYRGGAALPKQWRFFASSSPINSLVLMLQNPEFQNLAGFLKMADRTEEHFVMIPFMAQGHIIPFIALALQIEKRRRCSITMVNTPLNVKRIRASLPPDSAIKVQAVPFCSSDFGLPPSSENTGDLPYHLILPLFEASMSLEPSFRHAVAEIVRGENDGATICLITDIYFSWCAEIAREFEIFYAIFSVVPAFSMACYYSVCLNLPHRKTESEEFILPDFPEASKIHITQLSKSLQSADGTDVFSLFSNAIFQECVNADAMLINTIEEIDGIGLNYFRKKGEGPVWATGPLLLPDGKRAGSVKEGEISSEFCISWLDSKPVSSVLYVSFGSQNTPSKSQMMQLAIALEACGKSFIWVVRPPLECDDINAKFNFDEWLPEGFTERVKSENRGILIEKWAPQVEILSHKSTSAFLTQCGWNSVMESLIHGVPLLGWAMATEQFFTVKQLDEHLGVCVEVGRGKSCDINHEQIRAKIELLMNETEKGREVREKTLGVKKILESAMKDEVCYKGSSVIALDEFITAAISGKKKETRVIQNQTTAFF